MTVSARSLMGQDKSAVGRQIYVGQEVSQKEGCDNSSDPLSPMQLSVARKW